MVSYINSSLVQCFPKKALGSESIVPSSCLDFSFFEWWKKMNFYDVVRCPWTNLTLHYAIKQGSSFAGIDNICSFSPQIQGFWRLLSDLYQYSFQLLEDKETSIYHAFISITKTGFVFFFFLLRRSGNSPPPPIKLLLISTWSETELPTVSTIDNNHLQKKWENIKKLPNVPKELSALPYILIEGKYISETENNEKSNYVLIPAKVFLIMFYLLTNSITHKEVTKKNVSFFQMLDAFNQH